MPNGTSAAAGRAGPAPPQPRRSSTCCTRKPQPPAHQPKSRPSPVLRRRARPHADRDRLGDPMSWLLKFGASSLDTSTGNIQCRSSSMNRIAAAMVSAGSYARAWQLGHARSRHPASTAAWVGMRSKCRCAPRLWKGSRAGSVPGQLDGQRTGIVPVVRINTAATG